MPLINIETKMHTYAATLIPPCTLCVRIGRDPSPLHAHGWPLTTKGISIIEHRNSMTRELKERASDNCFL